jgi:protein-S-isoprenylcysteine O-methyltransferase Ste14
MDPFSAFARLLGQLPIPSGWFAALFWTLVITWVLSELFVGRLGLGAGSMRSDRGSALVVVAAVDVGLVLALVFAALGWLPIGAEWARWLGLLLMAAGLALRVFSILWLGPMFTRFVQIVPSHRLVTNGPYRFVRHPTYSGLLLFLLGMGLALGSWLSVAALTILPVAGILYRIRIEERVLLAAFGEEYRVYMQKVGRLLPQL